MPGTTDQDQHTPPAPVAPAVTGVAEASVPVPPGLQTVRLSEEAARAIQALLDDEARPGSEGREMPTADASVLLPKDH
jgi:hypothetical protein